MLARENAQLLDQVAHKSSQLANLQQEHDQLVKEFKAEKERGKKLAYENDKVFAECQQLKKTQSKTQSTNEDNFRKQMKRITGELEMFETYVRSITVMFEALP